MQRILASTGLSSPTATLSQADTPNASTSNNIRLTAVQAPGRDLLVAGTSRKSSLPQLGTTHDCEVPELRPGSKAGLDR